VIYMDIKEYEEWVEFCENDPSYYERVTFTPNSENIRKMGPKPLKEELHDFYMKLKKFFNR